MHGTVSETFDRAYFLIFIYLIFSLILYILAFYYLDMLFNYYTITGGLYNLLRYCDLYSTVVLKRIAHCIVIAS